MTSAPAAAVYLAPRGFEAELAEELERGGRNILFRRDRLFGTDGEPFLPVWAENVWLEPVLLPAGSIREGIQSLRGIQRNWALFSTVEHRRATLIQEGLPKIGGRPFAFGEAPPSAPMGSWTLWSRDSILASARCSSPFPHGEIYFAEDKAGPPNRAYLKLWETFTRMGKFPGPGDLCLDLGSSPGGWSWVLANLGARVFSVDKAPLEPVVARHPLVEYCRGSAFSLEPATVGAVDWLFCDVACYPERLYSFISQWTEQAQGCTMVCTIKFSGKTDFNVLDSFLAIENSYAIHLFVNKHEVTWIRDVG